MTWCVSGCQGERASVLPICEHHCLSWQHHEVSSVTFLPRWRLFVWRFIVGFKCLWLLYQALILWAKSLMSSVVVFAPCSPDYNVEFFRNFQLVMNALDNRGMVYLADLCRSEWTLPSKMCLFCCPCSGQESRQQNVFGCRHSPHWERHGWLSGTSHGYQEGKDLLLNQLFFTHFDIFISMSCSWHSRQFPKCRVRQNATSVSLNLHRKPSQAAPFATRPLNPFTALCGPNISSSKFTTVTSVLSNIKMSTKLMSCLI